MYEKFFKKILILSLLFMPIMVFASNGEDSLPLMVAIVMEAFVSIHMSVFVLKPLSEIFAKADGNRLFWTLFSIRVVILLFFDFFITPSIAILDFFAVFVGAFLGVPISAAITKTKINSRSNQVIHKNITSKINRTSIKGIVLKCANCNSILQLSDEICSTCGTPFAGNNVVVSESKDNMLQPSKKDLLLSSGFEGMYNLSDDQMLEWIINKELINLGIDKSLGLIPREKLKRKKILTVIFCFLVFIFISLIFFHFPLYTYIIGIVMLSIFYKVMVNYNLVKYLKKEIKSSYGEKISNILMKVKPTLVIDNTKYLFLVSLLISVVLPFFIFSKPKILYEKVYNGYAVRYYILGSTNFKNVTIPEMYKNEKIVSLEENSFSNMWFLESVKLPDSVTKINEKVFKNCKKLIEINVPKNLKYLGKSAFYNAESIKKIEFPNTLTYLGSEAFYGAKSLEYVKLSNNITEIGEKSFENCTSLKSITIPDKIVRISERAFYGDYSLSEVSISKNSNLREIGSSAFGQCLKLYNITIPQKTYVNQSAFKESPTMINYFGSSSSNSNILNKHVLTIDNNGGVKTLSTNRYGKINLKISNVEIKDEYLHLTLHLTGGINKIVKVMCNGSRTHIYDDFYIDTYPYKYIATTTTFDFYY